MEHSRVDPGTRVAGEEMAEASDDSLAKKTRQVGPGEVLCTKPENGSA